MRVSGRPTEHSLDHHGLYNLDTIHWNLPTPALYEQAIRAHEGVVSHMGPLVVRTGHHRAAAITSGGVRSTARSTRPISICSIIVWPPICK